MHVTGILAASVAGDRFYALVLAQGVCKSPVVYDREPWNPLSYDLLYMFEESC